MAASRCDNIPLPAKRKKTEAALLDWLNKANQLIPKKRKDFVEFIYKHFDCNDFPESIVRSVWIKLKTVEKKIKECPTIILSSDDENAVQITEIMDFDELNSENEPNITVVQIPQPVPKTPEKKKRESHKSPSSKIKETSNIAQDQALLKKFKQQIILEELLKRDKEMLMIQQRKDKFQTAVQIEIGYAKRIQKERVEALAQEMLRLHKEGFREGLSPNSLLQSICLVDPPQLIPSEHVIAERLPSPDLLNDVLTQELSSDQINYEMVYPSGESNNSDFSSKNEKRSRKRDSDLTNGKRVKKKKNLSYSVSAPEKNDSSNFSQKLSKKELEAENLRRQLYIDTLIEMALPEVVEKVNRSHRMRPGTVNENLF